MGVWLWSIKGLPQLKGLTDVLEHLQISWLVHGPLLRELLGIFTCSPLNDGALTLFSSSPEPEPEPSLLPRLTLQVDPLISCTEAGNEIGRAHV